MYQSSTLLIKRKIALCLVYKEIRSKMDSTSKFRNLLNPGLSYNVDEDGNYAANGECQIMDSLEGSAGVSGSGMVGVSRLRARNSQLLADSDHRYQGEKVTRAELEESNEINDELFDPSLTKYFLEEDTSDEDIPAKSKKKIVKKTKNKQSLNSKKVQSTNTSKTESKQTNGKVRQSDGESETNSEEDEGEQEGAESDSEIEEEENEDDSNEDLEEEEEEEDGDTDGEQASFSFQDTGDYSRYADDDDDGDSDDDDDSEGETSCRVTANDSDVGSSGNEGEQPSEKLAKTKQRKRGPKGKKTITSIADSSHHFSDLDSDDEHNESDDEPGDDEEEADEQGAESEGAASEEEEEDDNVKAVDSNLTDEQSKARAVKKQLDLYDELFQCRIMMQKVVAKSHSLPQPDVFPRFLVAGPHHDLDRYKECLATATESASSLVDSLLQLQEAIVSSNPEAKFILDSEGANKNKKAAPRPPAMDDGDEEITSSEDEDDDKYGKKKPATSVSEDRTDNEDEASSSNRGIKRSLEQVEETLAKRHCAMRGYRDRVVKYWEERTRLLHAHTKTRGKSGGGGAVAYAAFEEGFSVMLNRLLADREKLLKRTQLRNIARGNMNTPIGGTEYKHKQEMDPTLDIPLASDGQSEFERYDPEIYDDTDFYSRYLEELLKYKMQRGTSQLTAKQFYDLTHKLRKTTKKVVDTRRSKGRKLKYDVVSSILQFFPMRPDKQLEQDSLCDTVAESMFARNAPNSAI